MYYIGRYYIEEDDLVPIEIVEKLKAKGFPIKHITVGPVFNVRSEPIAPHIDGVLKWLRKEKKIHIVIDFDKNMTWYYQIAIFGNTDIANTNYGYKSYEQSALTGIEYTLDNLI